MSSSRSLSVNVWKIKYWEGSTSECETFWSVGGANKQKSLQEKSVKSNPQSLQHKRCQHRRHPQTTTGLHLSGRQFDWHSQSRCGRICDALRARGRSEYAGKVVAAMEPQIELASVTKPRRRVDTIIKWVVQDRRLAERVQGFAERRANGALEPRTEEKLQHIAMLLFLVFRMLIRG
jgi:hypothetical protein